MIFTLLSGEEQGWSCAYRNLKDEGQRALFKSNGSVSYKFRDLPCRMVYTHHSGEETGSGDVAQ